MIREQAQTHMIKKMVDISQVSSLKGSTNSLISSPLKPHTNARTVCSRPHTECFWAFYERVALRTLWEINLWANICEHAISNELSNVNHVKKHLHNHYHVFTHGREPSRIPKRTLELLRNKVKFTPEYTVLSWLCYARAVKTVNKRQLRFNHVKILTFTAGYTRKEAQVHADMRLLLMNNSLVLNKLTSNFNGNIGTPS